MTIRKKCFGSCIVVIIVGVLVASCIFAYATEDYNEGNSIEAFVKIQCDAANIGDVVGDESVLPQVYASIESHKLIEEENRVENKVKSDFLSREATYRYAKKKGFGFTEEELLKKLSLLVSEMKNAEEYAEIEGYYNANGTSLEENIFDNYKFYETEYVINNMYSFYKNSYYAGNTVFNGHEYDNWMSYWEAIEKAAFNEYNKTKDFAIMKEAISVAIDVTECKDIETLKHDDVSNDDLLKMVEDTSVFDKLSYKHNEITGG